VPFAVGIFSVVCPLFFSVPPCLRGEIKFFGGSRTDFKRVFLKGKTELELQSANRVNPQASLTIRTKDILEQFRVVGVKLE
jgi:hypothetical protein